MRLLDDEDDEDDVIGMLHMYTSSQWAMVTWEVVGSQQRPGRSE